MSNKDISCKYCIARQAFIDGVVALATLELEDSIEQVNKLGLKRD